MLVDSHCHLSYEGLSEQVPDVLERAREAGVTYMLCICSSLSEFKVVSQVADNNNNVFCSVGIHPHETKDHVNVDKKKLLELKGRNNKTRNSSYKFWSK